MGSYMNPNGKGILITLARCATNWVTNVAQEYYGAIVNFVFLEGFYKYDTLNTIESSVGYRVVSDYRFYLDHADSTLNHFHLHYNKVTRLSGEEYEFYDVILHHQSFVYSQFYGMLQSGFLIDEMWTHYREGRMMQPVFGKF